MGAVAVAVEDVDARHGAVTAAGDELLARFFFVQDPDGCKIEVLQRHGQHR